MSFVVNECGTGNFSLYAKSENNGSDAFNAASLYSGVILIVLASFPKSRTNPALVGMVAAKKQTTIPTHNIN
jgi:hypothetical protein